MTTLFLLDAAPIVTDAHDGGARAVAALAGKLTYVMMMLTLCWGVLTATGWIRRITGHQALRSGHIMLASASLSFGIVHALTFQLLDNQVLTLLQTVVPFFAGGEVRWGLGVLGLDLMIAVWLTASMHGLFRYRNWLRFHQVAYVAVLVAAAHAWLGALANSDFQAVWLGAITIAAPAVTLASLRFLPPQVFVSVGLLDGQSAAMVGKLNRRAPLEVSVDNVRCHRSGFCQAEAPSVFKLLEDGRLQYKHHPDVEDNAEVRSAARACPMQAIQLRLASRVQEESL